MQDEGERPSLRDGSLILVARIFIRYLRVHSILYFRVHLCYFRSAFKEERSTDALRQSGGRNVCDKLIVRADGLATKGGTRDNILLRDTDLQLGESGGLGERIDHYVAFRHSFQSQHRDHKEGGNVVDYQRGCATIDVSR